MRLLFLKQANKNFFFWTYLATLLLSFHYFFITYINSSVLTQFIDNKNLGVLYVVGSLITLVIFANVIRILKKWGNFRLMVFFLSLEIVSILGLAIFGSQPLIILAFLGQHALYPILIVSLDIFIEHYSKNENTGKIRGVFLTILNSTSIVCPLLTGFIIARSNYHTIYFISAGFGLALLLLARSKFKNFRDPSYHTGKGLIALTEFLKNKNVKEIFMANLAINVFYTWMIVYIPIYLNQYLHFNWTEVGLIIGISLLPFLLFEIPLGKLADEKIGEKEILLTGFVLIIGALAIMGQYSLPNFLFWTVLLLLARSGASFVEVSSDTYFFKCIDPSNFELVSLWRTAVPIGYIIGTILGSLSLIFLPFPYVFIILALAMMIGLLYSAKIKDTL